jgi:hypothetical protein
LLIIAKIVLSINQVQLAKNMNGEPPLKVNFERIFNPQLNSVSKSGGDDVEKQGSNQDF